MKINAKWDAKNPLMFENIDTVTTIKSMRSLGGGVSIPEEGVETRVVGGRTKCYFHISPPGMQPLYYAIDGTKIYINSYKLALRKQCPKAKIEQAMDGVVYVFDGVMRKFKGQTINLPAIASVEERTPRKFLDVLLRATEDIYTKMGRQEVITSISGGTDGILTAYLLKAIGAKQRCVCVGRTEEDFDPHHALIYANHLGLNYEFIPLPHTSNDDKLSMLLLETLQSIEQTDFSNVLMGMCNVLIRRYGVNHGIYHHFNADFADVVLGNDMLTVGSYNKGRRESGQEATAESWAQYRLDSGLHTLPTNLQIAKVFERDSGLVRQVFYHPDVVNFLMSSPLEWVPASKNKVLYKEVLKLVGSDIPWSFDKKIGFYTGAGIGKIRLENPVLSDENIRKVFSQIKGT